MNTSPHEAVAGASAPAPLPQRLPRRWPELMSRGLHLSGDARLGGALTICTWSLASLSAPAGLMACMTLVIAAAAGAIIAVNQRTIAGITALGLALAALPHGAHPAIPMLLLPIAMLASSAMLGRVLMPRVSARRWPLVLVVLAIVVRLAMDMGGTMSAIAVLVAQLLAAHGGFSIARHLGAGDDVVSELRYSLADRHWLSETSRYLLLGRMAGGMAHELSQAMNVIGMANGNLGYILARADIADPHRSELTQRVGKIAAHSSAAATMLGQFRWFGQDGGRDGAEMTVGTALERAVMATRAATRKTGVMVDIRGDGLSHAVPLRHGLIEILAATALAELARALADSPGQSRPPAPIALEATRTQSHIEIAVVCHHREPLSPPRAEGIDRVTYDLVSRLAASAQAEIRRLGPADHPVRFRLRLPRDMI